MAMIPLANGGAGVLLHSLGRTSAMLAFAALFAAALAVALASRPIRSIPASSSFIAEAQ